MTSPTTTLTNSTRHLKIREEADNEYRKNAERMKIQYAKRKRHQINLQEIQCSVTVRIPRNERSSTDMPRLLCYILEAKNDHYRLREYFFVCVCLFLNFLSTTTCMSIFWLLNWYFLVWHKPLRLRHFSFDQCVILKMWHI